MKIVYFFSLLKLTRLLSLQDGSHEASPQSSGLTTIAVGGRIVIITQPDASQEILIRDKANKPEIAIVIGGARFSRFA